MIRTRFSLRWMIIVVVIAAAVCQYAATERRRRWKVEMRFREQAYLALSGKYYGKSNAFSRVHATANPNKTSYFMNLSLKYYFASGKPWQPVEPDPPEPD